MCWRSRGCLLLAAVLPLGLETAAHYRSDYADAAIAQARALAGPAEERLGDHDSGASVQRDLHNAVEDGQGVVLLDATGSIVDRAGVHFPLPHALTTADTSRFTNIRSDHETMLLAAVPVLAGTRRVGVVMLARPTELLEGRIHTLWFTLTAVALAAALAAATVGLGLSRWVTRPLRHLEEAVNIAGAGDLEARASISAGPPEVRRLAAAFDAMAGRLSILLEGHRTVIADVSHQLRTPMSALRLRLELLPQQSTVNQAELEGALDELSRLSRLVDGLLAVARADATTQRTSAVDLRVVVSERVSAWSALAAERDIDLSLAPCPAVRARAVPDHVEQVLDNLFGNRFDVEPQPRRITVTVAKQDDVAVLTISDDGPGMSSAEREHAFARFATGHADTGGIGLGLAIVQRLITAGGGSITLGATPGGGLTAVLTLPGDR